MAIRPVVHLVGAEFKDRINQLIAKVGGIKQLPSGEWDYHVRERLNHLSQALGVPELAVAESTLVRAKINQLIAVANNGGAGGVPNGFIAVTQDGLTVTQGAAPVYVAG